LDRARIVARAAARIQDPELRIAQKKRRREEMIGVCPMIASGGKSASNERPERSRRWTVGINGQKKDIEPSHRILRASRKFAGTYLGRIVIEFLVNDMNMLEN
jgi:hypothetical protein